jgi:hypothetical protein
LRIDLFIASPASARRSTLTYLGAPALACRAQGPVGPRRGATRIPIAAALAAALLVAGWGAPRTSDAQAGQFGIEQRADATRRMIILAVQQAIGTLPPTSAQSFTYRFDPTLDTYIVDTALGPTALRSARVIGSGRLSLRAAVSYLDLDDTLGPIDYKVVSPFTPDPPGYCTRFGVKASSRIELVNLAATYGIANWLEAGLNLPLVVSDTKGFQTFASNTPGVVAVTQCSDLAAAKPPIVTQPFSGIVVPGGRTVDFNDGSNIGVGRISLAGKAVLYTSESADKSRSFEAAVAPEFFFPSPNEAQFAGSASAAFVPRLVLQAGIPLMRLHLDVGYDWDFDDAELRRFAWDVGASVPLRVPQSTFDIGLGGSVFEKGIQWTPKRAPVLNASGQAIGSIQALGSTTLGNDFLDFLFGVKVAITERTVLSGTVSVPLNNEGFRADAVGTVAVEYALF